MNDFGKAVRQALAEAGCFKVREGKGDHEIWKSPHSGKSFPVDNKIKSRHTANGIMKQAGIAKKF
jgi:predicted RNA binding protein YcfA (HicA-like mRNA interferase family)